MPRVQRAERHVRARHVHGGHARAVLAVIYNATIDDSRCEGWLEASERKWLFGHGQGWTRQQAHELAGQGVEPLGIRVMASRSQIQVAITVAVVVWAGMLAAQGVTLKTSYLRPYSVAVGAAVLALYRL